MKFISSKLALPRGLGLLVSLAVLWASVVYTQAQSPFAPPTNPMAQRNALNLLLNQVNWFQNGARSASSYPGGGYGLLVQQFQAVRNQYNLKNAFRADGQCRFACKIHGVHEATTCKPTILGVGAVSATS